MSDTGTATVGMMVVRGLRRNTNTTMMTSTIEIAMVISISRIDARMVGMMVVRGLRRNTNTTMMTSTIEIAMVISMSRIDARMVVVRSKPTDSFMAGGISAWIAGRMLRTRSTVSIMLAPGWRKTTSWTAGLPSMTPVVGMRSTAWR